MHKEMIVSSTSLETRLAILTNDQVSALLIERAKNKVYSGKRLQGKGHKSTARDAGGFCRYRSGTPRVSLRG